MGGLSVFVFVFFFLRAAGTVFDQSGTFENSGVAGDSGKTLISEEKNAALEKFGRKKFGRTGESEIFMKFRRNGTVEKIGVPINSGQAG